MTGVKLKFRQKMSVKFNYNIRLSVMICHQCIINTMYNYVKFDYILQLSAIICQVENLIILFDFQS